ncbi:MAG: hypothetical protein JSV04_07460, partial [Candidatus Heimdallarchaeota archaeon]
DKSEYNQVHSLWLLLAERNLECFKLIGQEKDSPWKIYFIDLETPILFYPILQNEISLNLFKQFSFIVRIIKSNLLNFYNQESESMFIWIKKDTIDAPDSFYTFKLTDQDTTNMRGSIDDKKRQRNLVRFLTPHKQVSKERGKQTNIIDTNESKTFLLQNAKKRIPVGNRSPKNRLNLLTGREWIKFTKSWYIHRPPPRKGSEILHPAKYPETMIRQYITFFTKPGELVVDPFLGSGSTLVAAKQSNRSGVGVELSSEYAEISKRRLDQINQVFYPPLYQTPKRSFWQVICGDSRNLLDFWEEFNLPTIDFCITSPPYWSQLERNSLRQKDRKDQGLDTKYSDNDPRDLGNIQDYEKFLQDQQDIFGYVYDLLRPKGYLVLITSNIFADGKVYPLAYDAAVSLTHDEKHPWILKDEKIWLQDDKSLIALGVNYAWVGNRCHQYCLILRKEPAT